MRVTRSGADDEVVSVEMRDQMRRVDGAMLAVRVGDQDEHTNGLADAGLDCCAIAFVVWMSDDAGAGGRRPVAGVVGGAVVHHQNFQPPSCRREIAGLPTRSTRLVEGGNDDRRLCRVQGVTSISLQHSAISRSTTPSHVIAAAHAYPRARTGLPFPDWRRAGHSGTQRLGCRIADQAGDLVFDELERPTSIGRCHYCLAGQERFERHVAVVLVERWKNDGERAGVRAQSAVPRRRRP